MAYNSFGGAKKSLYIFLCSILGMLLFLILHRIVVFAFLLLQIFNYPAFDWDASGALFLAADQVTLSVVLLLGAWYGIWLGDFWYRQVYEEGRHKGWVYHLMGNYWPSKQRHTRVLMEKIQQISQNLAKEAAQAKSLAHKAAINLKQPASIKRRLVKKPPPK